jgi:hypothetical protein
MGFAGVDFDQDHFNMGQLIKKVPFVIPSYKQGSEQNSVFGKKVSPYKSLSSQKKSPLHSQ